MESSEFKDKKVRKLLKESAFLNFSTFAFIFFRLTSGFLVAKFLGPSLYGLRTIFGLVIEYEYFAHLGTFDAMRREIPYHSGKGDNHRAELISESVFGINMIYSAFVFLCMAGLAFYLNIIESKQIYIDFAIFIGLNTIFAKVYSFYLVQLAVNKKVDFLSSIKILYGIILAALCVSFTYYWSLRGLLIGILLANITIILVIFFKTKKIPHARIQLKAVLELVQIGFPIMLIPLIFILLRSTDRIIVAGMLSKEMLGYFAAGMIPSGVIFAAITDLVNVVFIPRIMEQFGKSGNILHIKAYFINPIILVAYCIPFLIGALFFSIHIPIKYFLPNYLPAIPVAQVLISGAFFISIMMIPAAVCVALDKQHQIVKILLLAVLINAIFSFSFILLGFGINGVAIGTCASYFILSLLIIQYTMKQFKATLKEWASFAVLIYAPFCYAMALIMVFNHFLKNKETTFYPDLMHTALSIIAFSLFFSLSLVLIRKKPVFQTVLGLVKTSRRKLKPTTL